MFVNMGPTQSLRCVKVQYEFVTISLSHVSCDISGVDKAFVRLRTNYESSCTKWFRLHIHMVLVY
jgi:hypothetical protein